MGNSSTTNKGDDSAEGFSEFLEKYKEEFEERWNMNQKNTARLDDFKRIKPFCETSIPRVMLVQHKETKEYYVMKIFQKDKIVRLGLVASILNRKKILRSISLPFQVNLKYHFKDNSNVYMITDDVPCYHYQIDYYLSQVGRFSEQQSRFYAAQIVLAFEYLHFLGIVFRKLSSSNLLIDRQGYLKLVNFDFAKRSDGKLYTLDGKPEYLSPEWILSKGYDKGADWWALGCLLYEMSAGYPPFTADQPIKIFEKIVIGKVQYPSHFSSDLKNLLKNLLQVDSTKRYGNLKNGVNDIKQHKWFKSIDWTSVWQKKLEAPFLPKGMDETTDLQEYKNNNNNILNISSTEMFTEEFLDF